MYLSDGQLEAHAERNGLVSMRLTNTRDRKAQKIRTDILGKLQGHSKERGTANYNSRFEEAEQTMAEYVLIDRVVTSVPLCSQNLGFA